MSDSDADFIKNSVGLVLARALAEASIAKPEDLVKFIGERLLSYLDEKKQEKAFEDSVARAMEHKAAWEKSVEEQKLRDKQADERRIAKEALEAAKRAEEAAAAKAKAEADDE